MRTRKIHSVIPTHKIVGETNMRCSAIPLIKPAKLAMPTNIKSGLKITNPIQEASPAARACSQKYSAVKRITTPRSNITRFI